MLARALRREYQEGTLSVDAEELELKSCNAAAEPPPHHQKRAQTRSNSAAEHEAGGEPAHSL